MILEKLLDSLMMYFILALIFESAFSIIFNWSVFIRKFKDKGAKTIIMVVSSIIIFGAYDIDIITSVVNEYKSEITVETEIQTNEVDKTDETKDRQKSTTWGGKLVTALFIAGGSGVVNNVLNTLKLRKDAQRKSDVYSRETILKLNKSLKTYNKKVVEYEKSGKAFKKTLEKFTNSAIKLDTELKDLKAELVQLNNQDITGKKDDELAARKEKIDKLERDIKNKNTSIKNNTAIIEKTSESIKITQEKLDDCKLLVNKLTDELELEKENLNFLMIEQA